MEAQLISAAEVASACYLKLVDVPVAFDRFFFLEPLCNSDFVTHLLNY